MKLNRVYISIGSNTAPEENLPAGVELLRTWMNVIAVSPVYESLPIGGSPNDARFLNAALYVETYTYLDLLRKRLRSLEHQMGRVRTEASEGQAISITLDLDILLFNNEIDRSILAPLPHPDLLQYAHVIIPVADIAPDFQHPVTGSTLAALAAPFRDTAGLKQRDDVKLA